MILSMPKNTLAAFDFDCTLTRRDMFHPFVLYALGGLRWAKGIVRLTPHVFKSRHALKEKALQEFFPGYTEEDLKALAEPFAVDVVERFIKKRALEQLKWHQNQGHTVAIVSAGLETYIAPWAKSHGVEHVLATRLETDSEGVLTGKLLGANCRGPEKVRRILETFGPKESYLLYAYGDSAGDREMLALADHPFFRKI